MGSMAELLRVFDLPIVMPEINSLQTAVRRVAHEYLNQAEDYGYSPDICGYVKADVAVQLRHGEHPMGRIPPAFARSSHERLQHLHQVGGNLGAHVSAFRSSRSMFREPARAVNRPGPETRDFENDRTYVLAQVKELITVCERLTGKKFDIDRLRETLQHANVMSRGWRRVLELNQSTPSVFNALTDGTIYLGVSNGFRGTYEGAKYFEDLVEEMEFKAAQGIGTMTDEKYRLLFVGVPCYPIFRRFNELFSEWGGTFVNSTYLWFAAGGVSAGFRIRPEPAAREFCRRSSDLRAQCDG